MQKLHIQQMNAPILRRGIILNKNNYKDKVKFNYMQIDSLRRGGFAGMTKMLYIKDETALHKRRKCFISKKKLYCIKTKLKHTRYKKHNIKI
jgi:5-keto 4-deoxyuronate isomerase